MAAAGLPSMPMLPGVLRPDPTFHQDPWRSVMPSPAGPGESGSDGRIGEASLPATRADGRVDDPFTAAVAALDAAQPSTGAADPDAVHPMKPLGQFRHTYILAVDRDGLAIIDQHVAHERVLYERIYERLTSGRLQSQRLLTPLVFEMDASQRAALDAHGAYL